MFKKIDETSYPEKLPRAVADIIRRRWTPVDSGPIAPIGDANENNRPDTRSERRMAGRHLQAKQTYAGDILAAVGRMCVSPG